MRTFTTIFGTGFTVLLLAATAQAGGGKVVTPPSAGLVAGLPPELSYILSGFTIALLSLARVILRPAHIPMIHMPTIAPEWRDSFEGLVWEGKTEASAKLLLDQIAVEAGGYAMRDQVSKYDWGPGPPPRVQPPR